MREDVVSLALQTFLNLDAAEERLGDLLVRWIPQLRSIGVNPLCIKTAVPMEIAILVRLENEEERNPS